MNMTFMYNGTELLSIPLLEATTENIIMLMDSLAESYDIDVNKIVTRVRRCN